MLADVATIYHQTIGTARNLSHRTLQAALCVLCVFCPFFFLSSVLLFVPCSSTKKLLGTTHSTLTFCPFLFILWVILVSAFWPLAIPHFPMTVMPSFAHYEPSPFRVMAKPEGIPIVRGCLRATAGAPSQSKAVYSLRVRFGGVHSAGTCVFCSVSPRDFILSTKQISSWFMVQAYFTG